MQKHSSHTSSHSDLWQPEQLHWPTNKNTQQQPPLHPCGEWNRNAERGEGREKSGRVISFGDGFTLVLSYSLPFSFTSSLLHPPLLSEAVTPARCTSLTPHAAFLSFPEKSLVKWQWTKSCWLAPGSGGERKSGEGRGISGLMPTSGHSSVNCCTAQCGSAQQQHWAMNGD